MFNRLKVTSERIGGLNWKNYPECSPESQNIRKYEKVRRYGRCRSLINIQW